MHYYGWRKQYKKIQNSQIIEQNLYLSLPFASLFTATWASCRLPQRQSFFFSWTQYSTSFKPQKWSLLLYIVLFSGLKVIFSKLSQLYITACIKNCVYNNFDFCCYFMSSSIEHLYKSFSFVNSSVQLSNLNLKFLEILQPYSEPTTRWCSIKQLFLFFLIFTGKHLCWGLFLIKVAGLQASNCIKKGL